MAGVQDVARSVGEMRETGQGALEGIAGTASGAAGAARGLADFFRGPDNLLALLVCLIALIGLYRLLRAEHIIPAPAGGGGMLAGLGRGGGLRLAVVVAAIVAALVLLCWLTGAFAAAGNSV